MKNDPKRASTNYDPRTKGGSPDCFPIISYGTLQTFAGSLSVVVGLHFTAASVAVASAAVASTLLSLAGPIGAGVICVGLMVVLGGYLYCKYSGAEDEEGRGYDIENVPLPPPLTININANVIVKVISSLIGDKYNKELLQHFQENANPSETTYAILSEVLDVIVENYMQSYDVSRLESFLEFIYVTPSITEKKLKDLIIRAQEIYNEVIEDDKKLKMPIEPFDYEVSFAKKLLPMLWYTKKEFEASWIERLFGKTNKKGGKTPSRLPYEKRLKQDLYKLAVSRKLEVTKKTTKSDLIQLLRK